jgi:hypothetical protein
MRKRRNVAWLLAVVVGMMLVPAIDASAFNKAEKKHEKKQNAAIGKATKAAAKALRQVAAVTTAVGEQTKGLSDLTVTVTGIDNRLKFIESAAPAIVDGLSKLKAATEAGFAKVTTVLSSTEYGVGQAIVVVDPLGTPTPTPEAGNFVVTPDIPDTVQQAQTSQTFKAQHIGLLVVQYAVRSGETDGTGASDPAALCKVTVTNELGATQSTAANPAIGNLPFQPVPNKSALTSTIPANAGFPFGLKTTAPDEDKTVTFQSTVPVDNTDATNDTYTVGLACVDTSPSTTDPGA